MPNLKKILGQGFTLHQMNASIPDISSVSWTSFNTGVNPGEHGIYGFTDLKPDSYSLYFPNSKDVKASTFWEILGNTDQKPSTLAQTYHQKISHPYRSIIFNVPHTYPALPMNGMLVSGFVAIDLKKATFPQSVYTYLHSMNYLIDVEAEKAKEDKRAFMKSLFECFEVREKAITHLFKEEPWDIFFACITETDPFHHFFFVASAERISMWGVTPVHGGPLRGPPAWRNFRASGKIRDLRRRQPGSRAGCRVRRPRHPLKGTPCPRW